MILNKNGIPDEDKKLALSILNKLRMGKRVFGNPGEGLKKTLKELEEKNKKPVLSPTKFIVESKEYTSQIAMIKAGITGEEMLASHIEKIVKYNKELDGLIVFASLSYEEMSNEDSDYISDTDFIAIYGNNILILDAKYIRTSPENPIFLEENELKSMSGTIMEVTPSNFVWKKFFTRNKININSIDGCIVIVNKIGATVWKNKDWYSSYCKPIFIADLEDYLVEWVRNIGKDVEISLDLLTKVSKSQIRKEKSGIEFSREINRFKIR